MLDITSTPRSPFRVRLFSSVKTDEGVRKNIIKKEKNNFNVN